MPIVPPITPNPLQYTALDICTDAAIEVGMISPGETLSDQTTDGGQWIFRKLNDLIDLFQAKQAYVYSYGLASLP